MQFRLPLRAALLLVEKRREKKRRSKGKKKTEMALSQSVLSSRCRSGFDVLSNFTSKNKKNMDVAAEEVNTHFLARTQSKNLMKAPYTTERMNGDQSNCKTLRRHTGLPSCNAAILFSKSQPFLL